MRSPNDLVATVARVPERFADYDRAEHGTLAHPDAASAYNEDVFQYFLDIERRRSRVSGHTFLLLVISSSDEPGELIQADVSDRIFAALAATVRDTDFIGWYSQGTSIGAVLIQAADASKLDPVGRVSSRLSRALVDGLPSGLVERLRFRLCQVRADGEVWS